MPVTVTPLTAADIDGAVTCIQQAFDDDPYNHWVFDRARFSAARNRASLGMRCRWGMQHALFFVAKDAGENSDDRDRVLGVACWLPPRDPRAGRTWAEAWGAWKLWLEQGLLNAWYGGHGGLRTRRYWIWKQAQAAAQAELWDDPRGYFFCNIVAVLPEAQGRGIGRALFRAVTDRADELGRKCYLESSKAEPNMAIYRKMGFELKREMPCDDGGDAITLYCMIREPKGGDVKASEE